MKSFIHFIKEQDIREQEEHMGFHSKTGKPHLPSVTVHDSHGEAHQAPFHSEIEGGKVRYDLTDALEKVKKKGAFFRLTDGVAAKELTDHHAREFRSDIATEGGARGLAQHGVMMLTFTPEHREDGDSGKQKSKGPKGGRARRMPRGVSAPRSGAMYRRSQRPSRALAAMNEDVENWDQQMAGDEEGNQYKVKDLYDYGRKHGRTENISIGDTDGMEWWHKKYSMDDKDHLKRMMNADTSVPVLAVEYKPGKYSIADGLNRIKKAHSVERKSHIPAVIIHQDDMKKAGKKEVSETVVKQGNEWVVKGEAGGRHSKKVFGRHASRKKAMKQLAAIEISKARRK